MGSIYSIQHGQASPDADDYDVLSPTNIRQAGILGDHLSNLGTCFDCVLGGDLRRRQHTARAALEHPESSGLATSELGVGPASSEFEADMAIRAHLSDLLEEQPETLYILHHVAEHRAEFQRPFSTTITRWVPGNHEKDGLGNWQEFLDRVHDGPRRLLARANGKDRVTVLISGGTITTLLRLIVGVPPFKAFELD